MILRPENVLKTLGRIFDQLHSKESISSELSELKELCETLLSENWQGSKLESRVGVCAFSKLQFPKSQSQRCVHHVPVGYESTLAIYYCC